MKSILGEFSLESQTQGEKFSREFSLTRLPHLHEIFYFAVKTVNTTAAILRTAEAFQLETACIAVDLKLSVNTNCYSLELQHDADHLKPVPH